MVRASSRADVWIPNPGLGGVMNRHARYRLDRELDAYLAFWTEVAAPLVPPPAAVLVGGWLMLDVVEWTEEVRT